MGTVGRKFTVPLFYFRRQRAKGSFMQAHLTVIRESPNYFRNNLRNKNLVVEDWMVVCYNI